MSNLPRPLQHRIVADYTLSLTMGLFFFPMKHYGKHLNKDDDVVNKYYDN